MVNSKKLETGLRTVSTGIPYTLLLRIEAIGFPTVGLCYSLQPCRVKSQLQVVQGASEVEMALLSGGEQEISKDGLWGLRSVPSGNKIRTTIPRSSPE